MAKIIPFELPKPAPLMIRYCDKPDCPRCKPRSEWTNFDYEDANDRDKEWMEIKGFRYDAKATS